MFEIKKPELNENKKLLCNKVYMFLKNNKRYCNKEELTNVLGWELPKYDRQIRDIISIIAKLKPIISTSDSKGYKLAQTKDDIDEVNHQWAELSKRSDEILDRCKPLINFIDKLKK